MHQKRVTKQWSNCIARFWVILKKGTIFKKQMILVKHRSSKKSVRARNHAITYTGARAHEYTSPHVITDFNCVCAFLKCQQLYTCMHSHLSFNFALQCSLCPPGSKLLQKPETTRKHRPLNITGTFFDSFIYFFHIALVLHNCVSFVVKLHSVCAKSRPFSPLTLLFVRFSARSCIT